MRKRNSLLIIIFLIFILTAGLFVHTLILNAKDWREIGQRYNYGYSVQVEGLSGREVAGTTTIMVPIPATKDGKFVTTPPRKEPTLAQKLMHEYVLHTPEKFRKGPDLKNSTETLDNRFIIGNWTTFIAETDEGYMLGFKTNESILSDIDFGSEVVVVDYIDIFDPIHKNGPILYPMRNLSTFSMTPYGDQLKYSSNQSYDSYVYLSDNIGEGYKYFDVTLRCVNDPNEWDREYCGSYQSYVKTSINETGEVKVGVVLKQTIPHGYGIRGYPDWVLNST